MFYTKIDEDIARSKKRAGSSGGYMDGGYQHVS